MANVGQCSALSFCLLKNSKWRRQQGSEEDFVFFLVNKRRSSGRAKKYSANISWRWVASMYTQLERMPKEQHKRKIKEAKRKKVTRDANLHFFQSAFSSEKGKSCLPLMLSVGRHIMVAMATCKNISRTARGGQKEKWTPNCNGVAACALQHNETVRACEKVYAGEKREGVCPLSLFASLWFAEERGPKKRTVESVNHGECTCTYAPVCSLVLCNTFFRSSPLEESCFKWLSLLALSPPSLLSPTTVISYLLWLRVRDADGHGMRMGMRMHRAPYVQTQEPDTQTHKLRCNLHLTCTRPGHSDCLVSEGEWNSSKAQEAERRECDAQDRKKEQSDQRSEEWGEYSRLSGGSICAYNLCTLYIPLVKCEWRVCIYVKSFLFLFYTLAILSLSLSLSLDLSWWSSCKANIHLCPPNARTEHTFSSYMVTEMESKIRKLLDSRTHYCTWIGKERPVPGEKRERSKWIVDRVDGSEFIYKQRTAKAPWSTGAA